MIHTHNLCIQIAWILGPNRKHHLWAKFPTLEVQIEHPKAGLLAKTFIQWWLWQFRIVCAIQSADGIRITWELVNLVATYLCRNILIASVNLNWEQFFHVFIAHGCAQIEFIAQPKWNATFLFGHDKIVTKNFIIKY